eukprot:g6221.t1
MSFLRVFVLCAFLFGLATCDSTEASLSFLQGTWTTQIRNADVAILTPQGLGTVCRASLPPECEVEIPTGLERYTFHGSILEQEYTHLIGVNTTEAAAELMPTCAEFGIYPTQFKVAIPPSEIISYNFFTGQVMYKDARRPNEFDCVIAKYNFNKGDVFVSFEQRVYFQGSLEEVFKLGPRFRCDGPPPECQVDVNNETGMLSIKFFNPFDLKCTAGDCVSQIEILKHLS